MHISAFVLRDADVRRRQHMQGAAFRSVTVSYERQNWGRMPTGMFGWITDSLVLVAAAWPSCRRWSVIWVLFS